MPKTQSKDPIRVSTPVGRLINQSFFEKDVYVDEKGREADPSYKFELVVDEDEALVAFENEIVRAAVEEWGEGAEQEYEEGKIKSPISSGDTKADEREKKGKSGDAYRGKLVIRGHTLFNKHGENAAGGVYVCDEKAEEVDFANRKIVYRGCHGKANVTISTYNIDGRGVTLYLNGFQVIESLEGEHLQGTDPASLFSPMMGEGSENKGRTRRRG